MRSASTRFRLAAVAAISALALSGGALVSQAAPSADSTIAQYPPGQPTPDKPGDPLKDLFFEVNDSNFAQLVEEQSKKELLMVDVYNEHCFTCEMLTRDVNIMLKNQYKGKFRVAKFWNMKNPITSQKYGWKGVPVLMAIKDGKNLGELRGYPGFMKDLTDFLAKTVPAGK